MFFCVYFVKKTFACTTRTIDVIKRRNVLATVIKRGEGDDDEEVETTSYLERYSLPVTGVVLCLLVVLLSVAYVCLQQWKSRRLASKLTAPSTPAHEALLSRTEQTDSSRK